MTHSCLQSLPVQTQDVFKNFHSSPNKYKNRSRRERYYEGNVLCIKIGENIYKYPPKGGVIVFNQNMTKILMVRNNYHHQGSMSEMGFSQRPL